MSTRSTAVKHAWHRSKAKMSLKAWVSKEGDSTGWLKGTPVPKHAKGPMNGLPPDWVPRNRRARPWTHDDRSRLPEMGRST